LNQVSRFAGTVDAEQALEDLAGADLLEIRLRSISPGHVCAVGTGIPGVAAARLKCRFAADLQRWKQGRSPHRLGRELVDGDSHPDVPSRGLVGMCSSEEAGGAARMIAGTVTKRGRVTVRESAQHAEVISMFGKGFETRGQLVVAARTGRVPPCGVHAVGDVEECHPQRRTGRRCRARDRTGADQGVRHHRLEPRQGHGDAHAAKHGATTDSSRVVIRVEIRVVFRDAHGLPSSNIMPAFAAERRRNASVSTSSRMRRSKVGSFSRDPTSCSSMGSSRRSRPRPSA
jgi:hypothetical protein